jgi:Zn finger protein HypA/HybF involved in hydrogenase expression
MSILENFRDKVADAVGTARKASNEFIEVTKINSAVKSEEEKIKDLKLKIGQLVYESFIQDKPVDSELVLNCEQISGCEKNIDVLKEKILEIKNLTKCNECSSIVDRFILYCPKCGSRLESDRKVN